MKRHKRITIGFFIDWIENPYQCSLYSGIKEKALEKDVNLLTFIGGAIESPRKHEHLKNSIYRVVNKDNVDGLVVSSGSVSHFVNPEEFSGFMHEYIDIPTVSICQRVEGIHSILIDNLSGLYRMIVHLVEDHGYRDIAFISGLKGNYDADIRFNIYRKALTDFNIPFRPELVLPGDFTPQAGVKAVRHILDELKTKPQAIIAANDDMAFGAIEELQRQNVVIPRDIAVTGFDDQVSSEIMNPPLSTVRQPTYQMGTKALEIVLDIIDRREVPLEIYLPTVPVIRESCGCYGESISQKTIGLNLSAPIESGVATGENTGSPADHLETIVRTIPDQMEGKYAAGTQSLKPEHIREIVQSLFHAMEEDDFNIFTTTLKAYLYMTASFDREKEVMWQVFVSALRKAVLPFFPYHEHHVIEHIFHKTRLLIDDYAERVYLHKAIKEEQAYQIFRDIGEHIISLESMEDVLEILALHFPELGIQSCYLSLYEGKGNKGKHFRDSRLLFALNPRGRITIGKEGITFPTRKLLPDGVIPDEKPYSLLVESIFFGKNQLGIVLYEPGSQKSFTSEIMRRLLLNSALKGAAFIQQIQNQAKHLEAANMELHKTLHTLKNTQQRLVESKKMAALGGLVAGVAHEINTPIGIGVTAASHLAKKTEELLLKINSNELSKSELADYIEIANESTSMILSNLKRSHELIKSFKGIAVDQSSEEKRSFHLKEYIQDILLSLRPRLKKINHEIVINCPDDVKIFSYPGAFSQIITNLILNSLFHAFEDIEHGRMEIDIKTVDDEMIFTYSDNGKGIEEKNMQKIFDPFFTTKRAQGGTGLGLHLIYNIITQTLGGTIKCKSKQGKGTRFIMRLPLDNKKKSAAQTAM
ncbi:MAG: substrate-binding domain-containing protein [Spirochaetales bacterium]|nr:substrate-binding domain-containing protein [Spirochaetales bacterium]